MSSTRTISRAALGPMLAVLAVLLVGVPGLPSSTVGAPASPERTAPVALAHAAAGPPLLNDGGFSVNNTGPSTLAEVGSRVVVSYRLQVPNLAVASAPATVRVPGTVALLPTQSGDLHVYVAAANFTVAAGGSVAAWGNGTSRLTAATQFNTSVPAELETQGFAVMASWPHAAYTLQVQWQWLLLASDGTQTTGPWSAWAGVDPTQLAWLANDPPANVPLGGLYPLCLSGPIGGRTFSAHLSTTTPFQTLNGPSVTVPANDSGPYCWNTTMPSSIAPQSAYIHLWEYGAGTFLLYQLPLQLGGNSSGTGGGGGSTLPRLALGIGLGVGLFLLVVGGIVWYRWGARTRTASALGAPPAAGIIPGPPTERAPPEPGAAGK